MKKIPKMERPPLLTIARIFQNIQIEYNFHQNSNSDLHVKWKNIVNSIGNYKRLRVVKTVMNNKNLLEVSPSQISSHITKLQEGKQHDTDVKTDSLINGTTEYAHIKPYQEDNNTYWRKRHFFFCDKWY